MKPELISRDHFEAKNLIHGLRYSRLVFDEENRYKIYYMGDRRFSNQAYYFVYGIVAFNIYLTERHK